MEKLGMLQFFPSLKKKMLLMSIKFAFIWWYFCIGPQLRCLVEGF